MHVQATWVSAMQVSSPDSTVGKQGLLSFSGLLTAFIMSEMFGTAEVLDHQSHVAHLLLATVLVYGFRLQRAG